MPSFPPSRDDDFAPTASWARLRLRADLLRRVRRFFDDRGFLEVETPLLSRDTVVDVHLDPLPVPLIADPRHPAEGPRAWLQTSPEFAMKRLLACGAPPIYQIAKAFRAGERGAVHNPEFTLVEWYRAGDGMREGMQLLADFASEFLNAPRVERLSYREAFQNQLGIDPHASSIDQLREAAVQRSVPVPGRIVESDRDEWLNLLLAESVEPQLGFPHPVILYDYPASQAALARVRGDEPPVAERFELYWRGVELANGYHELLDPEVLATRNREANQRRLAEGKYPLPEESRLLAAMRHGLPPCTGVALGFDRLVMLVAQAKSIGEVMAFPIDRA